jgi:epithelial splicing regulatory protein 1/2
MLCKFPDNVCAQLERLLRSKEIHPDHGGRQFCFCTDGPLHLRQCLHPEAFRKKLSLPSHFFRYFDLRRCVRQQYNDERPVCTTLNDMLTCILLKYIFPSD